MKLELRVERLSKSGDGVAPHNGRSVFIAGALPGEKVLAEVREDGKALRGELDAVLEQSAERRAPVCALASTCGGCDWMHLHDAAQLCEKQEVVVSALEHLGGVARDAYELLPAIPSDAPTGYRRRAVLHPVNGALGFNTRKSHERVAVSHCPALTDPLADLPGKLGTALGAAVLKELDEVRLLEAEGRVAVSFHFKGNLKPRYREVAELLRREGLVDGVVLHPAEGKGGFITVGHFALEEDGVLLRPDGFAQANAPVNRRLVAQAVELLDVDASHRVLELYSGNGNFTFRLAAHAREIVAVESFPLSVSLAQQAALKRGVKNVRFVQGDSEKIAKGFVNERERFDRLLVDPPRAGAPGVGAWASGTLASRVVYVACDPTSLARDAKDLNAHGFRPLALQVVDLFPQTHHIEAVMAFAR